MHQRLVPRGCSIWRRLIRIIPDHIWFEKDFPALGLKKKRLNQRVHLEASKKGPVSLVSTANEL
jgi:hypothetical protein